MAAGNVSRQEVWAFSRTVSAFATIRVPASELLVEDVIDL